MQKHQCRDFLQILKTDNDLLTELELNVSWKNTNARKELIKLNRLFGYPHTLNLNQNGLAHWTSLNINNKIYMEYENIFNEILIKDEYKTKSPYQSEPIPINFIYLYKKINVKAKDLDFLNKFKNILYDHSNKTLTIKTTSYLNGLFIFKIILESFENKKIDPNNLEQFIKLLKEKNNNNDKISRLIRKLSNQINKYEER